MRIGKQEFDLKNKSYIMGILNVTPDSFSDGGNFNQLDQALARGIEMINEGAHILDIGGESTRPGHEKVTSEEEIRRVVPVIEALRKVTDIPISIDTSKADVAEAAIRAGADMINDVWGFKADSQMASIAAKYEVPCCLMHNRKNMNYSNLIEDVKEDLKESIAIAINAGVLKERIMIDPGIGFAKNLEHNVDLLTGLEALSGLGYPILLGTSRKSFIGLTLGLPVNERVEATVATSVFGRMKGCCLFRVHDVKENARALAMIDILLGRKG